MRILTIIIVNTCHVPVLLKAYHPMIPALCLGTSVPRQKLAPLHELLHKKAKWVWGGKQEVAFMAAKNSLQANTLLVHYNPLILACDASPYGLGAVLSHKMELKGQRPMPLEP